MQNEDGVRKAVAAAVIDMSLNSIDTTRLKNLLPHLPLFFLETSVLVALSEESGHIQFLSAK